MMRINPFEIKVDYGNGQVVSLKNDASWERIRDYIDSLFRWDKSYPGDPVIPQEQSIGDAPAAVTQQPATAPVVTTALDPNLRIVDRIIIALGKSGGSLNTKETYQAMVVDGYINKASKPENNVHSKVRKYPSLIKMNEGTFTLLPAGWNLFHQLEQNGFQCLADDASREAGGTSEQPAPLAITQALPKTTASRLDSTPEITGTDYLLQALYTLGGSATIDELIDPMIEYGWRPKSATRVKKRHNASALVYTSREYVDRERGRAMLNEKGMNRLTERINKGLLVIEALPYQQNSPTKDVESHAGLFVQT